MAALQDQLGNTGDELRLGLPPQIGCCLFDLDGVVTRTAAQHAKAWKIMFDGFLEQYQEASGVRFVPFEIGSDYITHVDGKARLDGTRSFLAARGDRGSGR